MTWIEEYLCQAHPDLGRDGPVCPWTSPSLYRSLLWIAVVDGDITQAEPIERALADYREWLDEAEPRDRRRRRLKTLLVVFPDLEPTRVAGVIGDAQRRFKPEFVERGMMIGQFYPGCPEPGLRNADFHPLRSPVPLIAMRYMVQSDRVFLRDSVEFDAAWRRQFGSTPTG